MGIINSKQTAEEEIYEIKKNSEIREKLSKLLFVLEEKEEELELIISEHELEKTETLTKEINQLNKEIDNLEKEWNNIKEWKNKGFGYNSREKWLEAGLESEDVDYAHWLQDEIGITAQYILNHRSEQELQGRTEIVEQENNGRKKPCVDWKKSHPEFTDDLKKGWEERKFTDEEIEQWMKSGLKPEEADFANYLKNKRERTPEWCFHHGDIEELKKDYDTYKEFGFEINCSEKGIKKICKDLRNEWHPDKYIQNPDKHPANSLEEATEKFRKLQEVCESFCSNKKGGNWKTIHRDFTPKLQKEWSSKGFEHRKADDWVKAWIKSGSVQCGVQFHPQHHDLFNSIVKKEEGYSKPDWWANFYSKEEEKELNEKYPVYSKSVYNNSQEWLNNSFSKESITIFASEKNLEGELIISGKDWYSLFDYPFFVKGFESLEVVDISNNDGLTDIKISDLPELVIFHANNCQISSIKIENCPNISELSVGDNELENLDVSKLSKLTSLQCSHNKLIILDVTNNLELRRLFCSGNQITSLDLSKNNKLESFNFEGTGVTTGGIKEDVLICGKRDIILERTEGACKAGASTSDKVAEIPESSLPKIIHNEENYIVGEIIYEKIRPINSFEWKINKDKSLTKKELPTKLYNINKYNPKEVLVNNVIKEAVEKTKGNTIKSYTTLSYVCGPYACNCKNDCYECKDYIYKGLKKSLAKAIKTLEVINKERSEESKINHLWIDQLCINQNDQVEKAHEVRHMHKNYANSVMSLVAIHSNSVEEDKPPLNLPEILSKIINSKWFSRSWTFQEGWISKQTIFMFDDMLVDGRIMAGVWVLNLHDKSSENYRNLGEFGQGSRKFSTPIGWTYYKGGYNSNDNTSLSLSQSLGGIRKRGRGVLIDGIYSILGLLPYGKEVNPNYKGNLCSECKVEEINFYQLHGKAITCNHPQGQRTKFPTYFKEELNQTLADVMAKSLGKQTGYIEPFSWHGKGQKWLPEVEDKNGSTSVIEGVSFRFKAKNTKELYKENGDIELLVHKCLVKDIIMRPSYSLTSVEVNDNFLFPANICVEFENRYKKLILKDWFKTGCFTEEQNRYLEDLVDNKGKKKVDPEEKYTFKSLKVLLPENNINCENPLPKQEEEILVSGTYETLGEMKIGDILLVPDWKKWEVSKPFGILVSLEDDNYYHRKGLLNFLPKCYLDNWRELGKSEQKKITISLDNQYSVTVRESSEDILNHQYDTEEQFEKENGDPILRNRREASITEHAKVLKKEQVRNDWENRSEFKEEVKRGFLLKDARQSETNDWTNIISSFSSELVQKWISYGFTYEQCQDWINTNSPSRHVQEIQRPDYYAWLRDIKEVDVEWVLNYGDKDELEQEFSQWQVAQLQTQIEILP